MKTMIQIRNVPVWPRYWDAPLLTCDRGLAHGSTGSARIEWIRA